MGLQPEILRFFHKTFEMVDFKIFKGLRMCELGNQHIKHRCKDFLEAKNIPCYRTGKEYFKHIGFEHISIDKNGYDGALQLNLDKPILNRNLVGSFDIITNSGTTEHVSNQFECFKNIHNLCKEGGIFIHVVPKIGHWKKHSPFYYTFEFFRKLAEFCEYEIISEEDMNYLGGEMDLVVVSLRKIKNNDFISPEQFLLCR